MSHTYYKRQVLERLDDMSYHFAKNFSQMDIDNANIQDDMDEIQRRIKQIVDNGIAQIESYTFMEE